MYCTSSDELWGGKKREHNILYLAYVGMIFNFYFITYVYCIKKTHLTVKLFYFWGGPPGPGGDSKKTMKYQTKLTLSYPHGKQILKHALVLLKRIETSSRLKCCPFCPWHKWQITVASVWNTEKLVTFILSNHFETRPLNFNGQLSPAPTSKFGH